MPRGAEYVLFSPSFPLGDTVRSDLLLIVDASVPVKYDKRSRRQEAQSSSAQLVVFVAGLVRVFVRRFTRNGFPLRRTTNVSEVQNACTAHNIVAFAERGRFFFFVRPSSWNFLNASRAPITRSRADGGKSMTSNFVAPKPRLYATPYGTTCVGRNSTSPRRVRTRRRCRDVMTMYRRSVYVHDTCVRTNRMFRVAYLAAREPRTFDSQYIRISQR